MVSDGIDDDLHDRPNRIMTEITVRKIIFKPTTEPWNGNFESCQIGERINNWGSTSDSKILGNSSFMNHKAHIQIIDRSTIVNNRIEFIDYVIDYNL